MRICRPQHSIRKEMKHLKKGNRYIQYTIGITMLLIISYFMDEFLGLTTNPVVQASMLGIRNVIHISLLMGWCISLQRRIMNVQVRRSLVSVSILMIFWLTAKVIKYDFIADRTFWMGRYTSGIGTQGMEKISEKEN